MQRFADRREAGRLLATHLTHLRGPDTVVVGLPRGGVPVAAEVARALAAPLDVVVVRKLGVPQQPELAMGAIGEGDVRVLDRDLMQRAGVGEGDLAAVEQRERTELRRRAAAFRAGHDHVPLAGRVVIVVDDGIATGSTARAACQVVRAAGARRVVLAAPVAPVDWTRRLGEAADEYVCVDTPEPFHAIGEFYDDFAATSDDEVVACLDRPTATADPPPPAGAGAPPVRDDEVVLEVTGARVHGRLTVPESARGLVVFAHGSGSSRHSPRNLEVAELLQHAGLATLLFDLLTVEEASDRMNVFDIDLLAERLVDVTRWLGQEPAMGDLPIGYFGASTGAAAALAAAARQGAGVAAVVSRGGRPDLAGPVLADVTAPTLLIVGGDDEAVLELNRRAQTALRCQSRLAVVPGATHLFEEPGTLAAAGRAARDWFLEHLPRPQTLAG